MWVRGAAIRPVPPYAVVGEYVLEQIERELSSDDDDARDTIDGAFKRFESTQPELADMFTELLAQPLDETALALGYFLSIAVWAAFERSFKDRLRAVTAEDVKATLASLDAEEELRSEHGTEPIDLDEVVAVEQPAVMAFVNQHVETALDVAAREEEEPQEAPREVDVDDVYKIYRAILALVLSLSHAVEPTSHDPVAGPELLA
jgi:hypothetical protein